MMDDNESDLDKLNMIQKYLKNIGTLKKKTKIIYIGKIFPVTFFFFDI